MQVPVDEVYGRSCLHFEKRTRVGEPPLALAGSAASGSNREKLNHVPSMLRRSDLRWIIGIDFFPT